MSAIEIIPFTEDLLPAWADLHNAAFSAQHNFWRVNARVLKRRIVNAPGFDPETLLFAVRDGALVGFAHGGAGKRGNELWAVGVHPDARRSGVAGALWAALQARLGELRPDCRGMNACWGNARGPETSFFGMVEGIAPDATDKAALGFLQSRDCKPGPTAINLRVTPESLDFEPGRDARRRAETLGYNFGLLRGRCPVVGQPIENERPLGGPGFFTAAALSAGVVAGYCVAFATPELGPGRFGIFDLQVDKEHRRRGLGSAVVMHALLEMQGGRFTTCEVTTVPDESRGAMELYERLGFRQCARLQLCS